MNREDIIKLAREAGMHRQQHNLASNPVQYRYSYDGYEENLERFVALIAAAAKLEMLMAGHDEWLEEARKAEREACAKLCDEARAARLAEQIRARGNT